MSPRTYGELFEDLAEIDSDTFGRLVGGVYYPDGLNRLDGFYNGPGWINRIKGLMAETYGDDARVYVQCPSVLTRQATESLLAERGWQCHEYGMERVMEISVAYEKFDGWDE